ncbi:hypothetical protein F3Y22_tig00111466pilonHSYRG00037 [Hibiscus syriacus]|uniref:Uncharacterized protein n=1 Tax=Hibiscus syriacus TaxID=106335 RepID=A0A6A2XQT1_HIBSY|nr:hypothetical protein F3Y22_tig00111466pilonHSYRG00037 [Hibiscus syriacus]
MSHHVYEAENDCSFFFEKKNSNESCLRLEDSEAEAEITASVVVVTAITSDDIVGKRSATARRHRDGQAESSGGCRSPYYILASAGAELKRPRVENGSGGGFDYEKGFSSAPSNIKPSSNSTPSAIPVSYGSYHGSSNKIDISQNRPVELVGTAEQIAKAEQLINDVLARLKQGKVSALLIQVERKKASALPIQVERKEASALPIQIERKEASALPIQIERKEASALPIQIERKEASHFRFKSNGKKHRTSNSTRTNGLLNHCPNLHLRNFNPKCRFSHLLKEKEKSRENIRVSRIHDCILEYTMCAYAPNMSIVCVSELLKFVMNVSVCFESVIEGLDYALVMGGDVAPLGTQAVTKLHQLFDWARSPREACCCSSMKRICFCASLNFAWIN